VGKNTATTLTAVYCNNHSILNDPTTGRQGHCDSAISAARNVRVVEIAPLGPLRPLFTNTNGTRWPLCQAVGDQCPLPNETDDSSGLLVGAVGESFPFPSSNPSAAQA